jgi:hypothetical protein
MTGGAAIGARGRARSARAAVLVACFCAAVIGAVAGRGGPLKTPVGFGAGAGGPRVGLIVSAPRPTAPRRAAGFFAGRLSIGGIAAS